MSGEGHGKYGFSMHCIGHIECNRMGFGLTNAPDTFQWLRMERCVDEFDLRDCLLILADMLKISKAFDEHFDRLTAVFKILERHCLKAKKCELFKQSVTYNGGRYSYISKKDQKT